MFNSLVSLEDAVVVYPIFPKLPFHIQTDNGFEMGQTATEIVPLILSSWLDPSIRVLLNLRGVMFDNVLYGVISVMNTYILGVCAPVPSVSPQY